MTPRRAGARPGLGPDGARPARATGPLVILAFLAVAVAGVLLRPALPIDETRYLAVAWEMWIGGDWLVPTKNFAPYADKPPLLFWTIDLVWALTGVSETAARLVGPLHAAAALGLTGALARRLWPEDAGAGGRAALALAGTALFAVYGGLTMFDAMLTAATLAGLLALLRAIDTGLWRWWAGLGAAIALGALAKGPVILLHLGPAIALAPFWARGRAAVPLRRLLAGAALALATALMLVGLWLVPAVLAGGPDYRDAIVWTQSAGRVTQSFAHARPWWWLAALLPVLLFPWPLVPALWRAAPSAPWREPGLRLALAWGGSGLVLFSLVSGKQVHYLMPELPAAALVVARLTREAAPFRPSWAALLLGLAALCAAAVAAGLVPLGEVARLVEPRWGLLAFALLLLAVCALAVGWGGLRGGAVLSLGAVAAVNLLIGLTGLGASHDARPLADATAPFEDQGIAFWGRPYHAEINFAGRLTRPVALPRTVPELDAWRAAHPDGVILAPADQAELPWTPRRTIPFRNDDYAVWHVADAGAAPSGAAPSGEAPSGEAPLGRAPSGEAPLGGAP